MVEAMSFHFCHELLSKMVCPSEVDLPGFSLCNRKDKASRPTMVCFYHLEDTTLSILVPQATPRDIQPHSILVQIS
jgi:hypothetical protein